MNIVKYISRMGCIFSNQMRIFFMNNTIQQNYAKLYLAEFMLLWVWQRDYREIRKYINEEDPLGLKTTTKSVTKILSLVKRYKNSKRQPYFMDDERQRYNMFINEKRHHTFLGLKILVDDRTTHEYIDGLKLMS